MRDVTLDALPHSVRPFLPLAPPPVIGKGFVRKRDVTLDALPHSVRPLLPLAPPPVASKGKEQKHVADTPELIATSHF